MPWGSDTTHYGFMNATALIEEAYFSAAVLIAEVACCGNIIRPMSRTLKILLCNTHAETRKLWKRSARLPPLEAMPADQFPSRPLLHFTRPPRCPLHSPRFPGMQRYPSSRARVAPTIESVADMRPL